MSGLPGHLRQVLQGCPFCGLCVPCCCYWALITVGMSVGAVDSQADWLWRLSVAIADKVLWEHWSQWTGFSLAGFWCLLCLPFGYIICGAIWVVLWCGLMPAPGILVLGPLVGAVSGMGQVQPFSVPGPGPPGKIYKLNWLLAAYAVLGASWERLYWFQLPLCKAWAT